MSVEKSTHPDCASFSHLFVMDSVDRLNFELDTSVRIAKALQDRGHQTFFTTITGLSINSEHGPRALSQAMSFGDDPKSRRLLVLGQDVRAAVRLPLGAGHHAPLSL